MDVLELKERLHAAYLNLLDDLFLEPVVFRLEDALNALASHPSIRGLSPRVCETHGQYLAVKESDDISDRESALLELYLRLHALGWKYSETEDTALTRTLGNANIPGGLAPLVFAGEFIRPDTVSVDLGAGNGLQGLLMQYLYPHQKTIQVELSSSLIDTGRLFQKLLGIPEERFTWVIGDIREADFSEADFVYLYRPVRPHGEGNTLYRYIVERLSRIQKPLVVVSVADCLGRFLGERFQTLFENEHITVFIAR